MPRQLDAVMRGVSTTNVPLDASALTQARVGLLGGTGMTERVRETYEGLRDSVENNEARAAWLDHDRRLEQLTNTYRTLGDDPRYTQEHKASEMWAAYDREGERIRAAGEKARGLLEREARGHEMMSISRPKGERVTNLPAEKLIASQNEASRTVRKLERLQSGPGPFKANAADVLKAEYARGVETGGAEGVAICKGALMAADELGVSEEEFLGSLRTPEQQAELDKAVRCQVMAQSISTRIPEPPLRRTGEKTPGRGMMFVPRNRQSRPPKQGLSWLQR